MSEIRIIFRVNEGGRIQTDLDGFVGEACLQEAITINSFLSALGVGTEQEDFQAKPALKGRKVEILSGSQSQEVSG